MKFLAFSVYDKAAENYNTPQFFAAKGQAIRAFDDEANREDSPIHKHEEDYTLYQIGEFDDSTGQLVPLTKPVPLGTASDFKRAES